MIMINKEILPFMPEHVDLIDLREDCNIQDYKDRIEALTTIGLSYTLAIDNRIICCAGIITPHPKVAECWTLASKEFDQHGMFVARSIKGFLEWVQPFYHRFQMSVREDHPEAQKFAEFLGFEREGLMHKFDTEGNNYWLYARIKKD